MGLRSLSYSQKGLNDEILSLFTELVEDRTKTTDYACEIITSAMHGKIKASDFSLRSYTNAIRRNEKIKNNSLSKEVAILFEDAGSEGCFDIAPPKGCTYADHVAYLVAKRKQDDYDEWGKLYDLEHAVQEIKSMNLDLIIEEGVDLVTLMKQATQGVSKAVNRLKDLCNKYGYVSTQVEAVLESGKALEDIFPA